MLESLGFSPVTFVFTLINIAVLTLIFRAVLFKPVTKLMEERAKKIQDARDGAEKSRADAARIMQQLEERLKNAGAEAEEIVRAGREEAKHQAELIIAEARAEAERFMAGARAEAAAEYQVALRTFQAAAAALVVQAASKLARRNLGGAEAEARDLLDGMDGFPGGIFSKGAVISKGEGGV